MGLIQCSELAQVGRSFNHLFIIIFNENSLNQFILIQFYVSTFAIKRGKLSIFSSISASISATKSYRTNSYLERKDH